MKKIYISLLMLSLVVIGNQVNALDRQSQEEAEEELLNEQQQNYSRDNNYDSVADEIRAIIEWDQEDDYVDYIRSILAAHRDLDLAHNSSLLSDAYIFRNNDLYYSDLVRVLLEHGADPVKSMNNNNPVLYSEMELDAAKALLAYGADSTMPLYGNTIEHHAQGDLKALFTQFSAAKAALNSGQAVDSIIEQYPYIAEVLLEYLLISKKFDKAEQALNKAHELGFMTQENISIGKNINTLFNLWLLRGEFSDLVKLIMFAEKNNIRLNSSSDPVIDFLKKWANGSLNQEEAQNILEGRRGNLENALSIEQRAYQFAQEQGYKKLGKLIRNWATKARVLRSVEVLPPEIKGKIFSYDT